MKETKPLVETPNGAPSAPEISPEEKKANRRNGRKSRGPRTERGKAASSMNALKHGVFARKALPYGLFARGSVLRNSFAGESRDEFQALLDALDETFAPADAFERTLVERMTLLLWRLRRLQCYERSKVDWEISFKEMCVAKNGYPEARKPGMAEGRAERRLIPDEETLSKIVRYEAMLNREFTRCYALLEHRKQQAARGEDAPPLFLSLRL
jgi:hypothetical protein